MPTHNTSPPFSLLVKHCTSPRRFMLSSICGISISSRMGIGRSCDVRGSEMNRTSRVSLLMHAITNCTKDVGEGRIGVIVSACSTHVHTHTHVHTRTHVRTRTHTPPMLSAVLTAARAPHLLPGPQSDQRKDRPVLFGDCWRSAEGEELVQ